MVSKPQRSLLYTLLSCIAAAVIGSACNTDRPPCLQPLSAQVDIGCYQHIDSNNTYIDTLLPNVNFVSLDIDSARFWYIGVKNVSKFAIILSPVHDTTRWVIQADSAVTAVDTLTFIYDRKLKFLSNACGYTYSFSLKQVLATKNDLDSVAINNSDVTTKAGIEHVKIYY